MYYVLGTRSPTVVVPEYGRILGDWDCFACENKDVECLHWKVGQKFYENHARDYFRPPKEPINMSSRPAHHEYTKGLLPDYYNVPIPIMSKKLVAILNASGVDVDEIINDYVAINVIGLLSAADMQKSKYDAKVYSATNSPADGHKPLFFHSLVLDETKTHGILCFRLAQNPMYIFLHENIVDVLDDKMGEGIIKGLNFFETHQLF